MKNQLKPFKENSYAGQGAILMCAMLWSTTGLFIKLINWHPNVIVGCRSFSALIFLIIARYVFSKDNSTPFRIRPILVSAFWYFFAMTTFVVANKFTTSANAILLHYAAPVWACFLGWYFLKEKPHLEQWLAIPLIGTGMFLVFSGGIAAGSFLGDGLALLSGFGYASFSVSMRRLKNVNNLDVMILAHSFALISSIPFFFIFPPVMEKASIISVIFMGVFSMGAANALFAFGIKYVTAIHAILIATVEPVLNPVWVLLGTGERPSVLAIAGGIIIITAVIISSVITSRRSK